MRRFHQLLAVAAATIFMTAVGQAQAKPVDGPIKVWCVNSALEQIRCPLPTTHSGPSNLQQDPRRDPPGDPPNVTIIDAITDGTNFVAIDQVGSKNIAIVREVGEINIADITQTGMHNVIVIIQSGDVNVAVTSQTGLDNKLIIKQIGAVNLALARQRGRHNFAFVGQTGHFNRTTLTQTGFHHRR